MTREEAIEKCFEAIKADNFYIREGISQEILARTQLEGNITMLQVLGLLKLEETK